MTNLISNFKKLLLSLATDVGLRRESLKLNTRIREHLLDQNIVMCREPGTTTDRHLPDREVIVSLTTFGPRLRDAARSIESIMEQTLLPNRIILWLGRELETTPELIPASLRRLQRRGLEIRFTDDCGPATKLLPALEAFPEDVIITVDDDMLYDIDMIDRLVTAHRRFPEAVCAGRIDRLIADGDGLRLVYDQADDLYLTEEPLMQPMAMGVGGVLYPPHCMHPDVSDRQLMSRLAPKADDLWFKVMELLAGTPVFPVNEVNPSDDRLLRSFHYRQSLALHTYNVIAGQDNVQLAALVKHYPQIVSLIENSCS
ncbi:MAG: glycosyltransferase family 2 protein [Duncaniella sp.]